MSAGAVVEQSQRTKLLSHSELSHTHNLMESDSVVTKSKCKGPGVGIFLAYGKRKEPMCLAELGEKEDSERRGYRS